MKSIDHYQQHSRLILCHEEKLRDLAPGDIGTVCAAELLENVSVNVVQTVDRPCSPFNVSEP